jgi:hypothetical protein
MTPAQASVILELTLPVAEIAAANLADQLLQLHLRHVRRVDVLIWTTIFHFDALRPTSPVLCV